MTLAEVLLWNEVKNKQPGVQFSRQIPIDPYIVDFYCKDLRVAIEIDGITPTWEGMLEKDTIRQKRLELLGVKVLRYDDLDVRKNMNWVLNSLLDYLRRLPDFSRFEEMKNLPPTPPERGA